MNDELELSRPQIAVSEALVELLSEQIKEGNPAPSLYVVDGEGTVLQRILAPLDTEGHPISDRQIGEGMWTMLSKDPELANAAAYGFVRVDVDPPEIVAVDVISGTARRLRPRQGGPDDGWEEQRGPELDDEPRGGSGQLPTELNEEQREEERAYATHQQVAERALSQILVDAMKSLEGAAENANDHGDIGEQLIFDAGPVWQHGDVPEWGGDYEEVDERVAQLISHVRSLPTTTAAIRFLFDDDIYVLAVYLTGDHEAGFLGRTYLEEPGTLAELEHLDALPYLGA